MQPRLPFETSHRKLLEDCPNNVLRGPTVTDRKSNQPWLHSRVFFIFWISDESSAHRPHHQRQRICTLGKVRTDQNELIGAKISTTGSIIIIYQRFVKVRLVLLALELEAGFCCCILRIHPGADFRWKQQKRHLIEQRSSNDRWILLCQFLDCHWTRVGISTTTSFRGGLSMVEAKQFRV